VEKYITKSNGWKLEEQFKLGGEEGDYSYPDVFIQRPAPFRNQTEVVEHNVLARRNRQAPRTQGRSD